MPYYPIGDLASSTGPKDSGGGYEADLLTLGGENGFILPVFTEVNRFWAFVDVYLAGDDSIQPSTFPMDPFRLAEILEPSIETGELGFLVFNPTAVSPGQWKPQRAPIPVVGYVERNFPNLFLPDRLWMARFFNDNQLSVKWLSYVLASERYKNKIKNVASGTSGSMKNISQNALLKMTVELPSVEEQTAIATVLSDIDAEISALEARREKTQQVKQGMMQELLTGRTRLVSEGSFS